MKLERVDIIGAPKAQGQIRVLGEVSYRDGGRDAYWFEVDGEFEQAVSRSGNPWLACLLPLAVTLGEPVEIAVPVDEMLYEGAHELMHIWKAWNPKVHVVPVEAPILDRSEHPSGRKVASFFSGGADSFFTVLRHQDDAPIRLDDLILVWGLLDIPLANAAAFATVRARMEQAAAELGKRLVPVATNLLETRWTKAPWAQLSHGSALGAIALILEPQYSKVLIASSTPYWCLGPWGSHPLTDPLFSTSSLRIIHDAASLSRVQKLERLVRSDIAMRYLRVCWQSSSGDNCGSCAKCCRTMAALAALDALDRCETFRQARLNLEKVERMYSSIAWLGLDSELEILARDRGKLELAQAVRRSLEYSRRLHRSLLIVDWLRQQRVVWRIADRLEHRLRAGALS